MTEKNSYGRIVRGSLLVAGTTIGAGMLAIPLVTAPAGFIPGIVITAVVWLFMMCTGLLFLEVALWMPKGAHITSMARRYLGTRGKWVSGIFFLFLYYCLIVAYIAAGGPLLATFFQEYLAVDIGAISYLIFTLIFGIVVAFGPKSIDRINVGLVILMSFAYVSLIVLGKKEIDPTLLLRKEWSALLIPLPILFSGFGYHNIIPSLTTYFNKDRRAVQYSIICGTTIPFVVYLLWQWITLGTIPLDLLVMARAEGTTAVNALQLVSQNLWLTIVAGYFAFFAISTSLLGVSFSLVDFLADAFRIPALGAKRIFLCFLAFFPPLIFTVIDPTIFDRALGYAGGFGESVLNGLLPVGLVWAGRYVKKESSEFSLFGGKAMLTFLLIFSVFVILIEILNVVLR